MPPGFRGLAYLFDRDPRLNGSFLRTVAIKAERWRRRDRWRRSLWRYLASVDRIPLDRPIFVLGMQGGGTTLVARCLLRHPEVVSMSGGSDYWVATDELGFVRNRMRRLPPTLWSSAHRDDLDHPIVGTEHASVYASNLLLAEYRNTAEDANAADSARFVRILKEHVAVYAHDPQTARFLDKTHTYTIKIPYLDRLLEAHEPFFLLVVRNPYTMVFRAVRRKPPAWGTDMTYEDRLRLVAQHWSNSMRLALDDGRQTGRFVALRFEDFLQKPDEVIQSVCNAVGLTYDDDLVPRASHRMPFATLPWDRKWFPLQGDQWRDKVGDTEARIVEEECGEVAEQLGYGRLTDTAPLHPAILRVSALARAAELVA
ncbi:MAG TPA: sulfotransferase [Gaiellaceae bacterium]